MVQCDVCTRHFTTSAALQQHIRDSRCHTKTVELDKGVSSMQDTLLPLPQALQPICPDKVEACTYIGESSAAVNRVFKFACQHRHNPYHVAQVICHTKTTLEVRIVESLLSAAARVVAVDNSPEGRRLRQKKEAERAKAARLAEDTFVERLNGRYALLRENEQRQMALEKGEVPTATPDVVFASPVTLYGSMCCWIEYKSYFGFRQNPFVTASEKRQVRKYVDIFGPGVIVYSPGFEEGHMRIEGVRAFREQDVLAGLTYGNQGKVTHGQ